MRPRSPDASPRRNYLRWLASLLVRGADATFVTDDLDELYDRDRANGLPALVAHARYARRLFKSAFAIQSDDAVRDSKFAFRLFRRHKTPVAVTVAGFGVAIGVVTSAFTILDVTALRPYGMDEPSSIVSVGKSSAHGWPYWTYSMFLKMRDGSRFGRLEASTLETVRFRTTSASSSETKRWLLFVSGGYLEMLGGRPVLGRSLRPSDDRPGAVPVVVVSHRFWSTSLGGDPRAIGRPVWINGASVVVVGVLEPAFTGPVSIRPSLWAPLAATDDLRSAPALTDTSPIIVEVIARLDLDLWGTAEANLSTVVQRASPGDMSPARAVTLSRNASPLDGPGATDVMAMIVIVGGILGLVLIAACANTANLLLAAARTREREIGVRLSLGAERRRVVKQMMTETVLLGGLGGAAGFLVAMWLAPVLTRTLDLSEVQTHPDWRALLFTITTAILCSVFAGLSPARYGSRGDLTSALKSNPEQGGLGRIDGVRLRTSFIAFQVAVSVFLLVAAGLLGRSALFMARVDLGFDADRTVAVTFDAPRPDFDEPAYLLRVTAEARSIPLVEGVSVLQHPPFGFALETERIAHGLGTFRIHVNRSDADFFRVAGIRLLRGRTFTPDEVNSESPVAVIGESVARAFFLGRDPVGQSLSTLSDEGGRPFEPARITGVVADAVLMPWRGRGAGTIYLPIRKHRPNTPGLILRTAAPALVVQSVEQTLRQTDPRVQVGAYVVRDALETFQGQQRMFAALALPTALIAILLAACGVFGVTAFVVGQRTREVSVRIAVGATSRDVFRLLVTDSLRPVLVGLAAGLAVAIGLGRLIGSELSGISPHDPLAIGISIVLMLAVALAAVMIPARRSLRTDPVGLLRLG
jgi:predicted permease